MKGYVIDDIAEAIAARHPKHRTMAVQMVGHALVQAVEDMLNPRKAAEDIDRLHGWKCRYEWREAPYVPSLRKWFQSGDCFAPCPSEEEGEALLNPKRKTAKETALDELRREYGG